MTGERDARGVEFVGVDGERAGGRVDRVADALRGERVGDRGLVGVGQAGEQLGLRRRGGREIGERGDPDRGGGGDRGQRALDGGLANELLHGGQAAAHDGDGQAVRAAVVDGGEDLGFGHRIRPACS